MPDVLFVPTADLAPGHLQVRVGGTPGAPVRGLDPNELLVRHMGAATAAFSDRPDATITIDPSTGLPALLMNEGARLELEEAGIAYADARRVVIDVVIGELRAQRRRLLAIEDLDHQLSALRMAFPSLFQAAMASFALPDLVRIARMLVDEDVAIGNLANGPRAACSNTTWAPRLRTEASQRRPSRPTRTSFAPALRTCSPARLLRTAALR